ncbi:MULTISPECIES: DUF2232 domain-containing protein [Gemella]|uniref:DUF2232 domain-containing protein n=1 Tax=Gemella TaxID=1378 RepID=UPI0007684A98|nr:MULTISPECIES: DUF2232 domain-containing protein [Gemella]AME10053.1 hypothetical protein AXE85_07785 [Gemella sp. oral taxon 928]AXI26189.1 DUF2232 domain-containing protein [Gemella sp. ND 6198]
MKDNISQMIKEELEKLLANKFFFKEPSNKKVIAYSISFILLALLGALLRVEIIAAFLSVFPLTYVLGAKGEKLYLPLSTIGIVIVLVLSPSGFALWFTLHIFIAYIIYKLICDRHSKVILLLTMTAFLFLGLAIYVALLIKQGALNINFEQISKIVNDNVNTMIMANKEIDKNLLLANFESFKKTFPVTIFVALFVYSLGLGQYTLTMLSKEYVIIPTFPKFSRIMLSTKIGYFYVVLTLISLFLEMQNTNNYDFWTIVTQNVVGVLALAFTLNGLFTVFFFVEQNRGVKAVKPLLVIMMIFLSPIFELIGFVDSLFKLREKFMTLRKGR